MSRISQSMVLILFYCTVMKSSSSASESYELHYIVIDVYDVEDFKSHEKQSHQEILSNKERISR